MTGMEVNDSCRLCNQNLRIGGVVRNSKLIFEKEGENVASLFSKLGLVIERTPLRSQRVCRKCCNTISRLLRDIGQLEKWKVTETAVVVETCPEKDTTGPASIDKRDREPSPSKTQRRVKKSRRSADLPLPTRSSVTEVVISYDMQKRTIPCQPDIAGIVENLAKRKFATAATLIARNPDVMEALQVCVLDVVEADCAALCNQQNQFMLWRASALDLLSFSFQELHDDLKRLSPVLFSILSTIAKGSIPHICAAASVALRGREPRLSALAYYVNSVLLYGGAKKAAFQRLAKLGICTVHSNVINKHKEIAQYCMRPMKALKQNLESYLIQRTTLNSPEAPSLLNTATCTTTETTASTSSATVSGISKEKMPDLGVASLCPTGHPASSTPPTYSLIMDNLDFYMQTHHQSIHHTNKSIHWIHHMSVINRVNSLHMDDHKPSNALNSYNVAQSLPGPDTQDCLRREYVVLGSRILTCYLEAFKIFSSVVVHHIPHLFSVEMAQPSTHYPLGLLLKDETQTADLVDVLQHLQQEYVPRCPDGMHKILVGGDRLTEGNCRNAQLIFSDGETEEERLEGLVFKYEDWHAIRNLFEIYHQIFFTETSAKEHGTLFANMNLLRCSNAKQGPHKCYNAYKEFVQMDTTALFLAAAMEHFKLDDVTDTTEGVVPDHVQHGTEEQKRRWLHDAVVEVVDKFLTFENTFELSAVVADAAQRTGKEKLPCRQPDCPRVYVNKKSRETHEQKVHHLVVATVSPAMSASTCVKDYKKQHTEARLTFGFLLLNMLDAVKEGDGERLIRLYKVALPIYKAYGHSKYAYSTFLLTVQLNATLSPRIAHDIMWNRFWNGKGGKGNNIPLDLHLEHLNNFLKSFVRNKGSNLTEDTATRVSQSVGILKDLMDRADRELQLSRPSGTHHAADVMSGILTLVDVFRKTEVFREVPGRQFASFPIFNSNILSKLDWGSLHKWMQAKIKEWRGFAI